MITKFKLFESNQYNLPEYLYHGSDKLHDFTKTGDVWNKGGTFLATKKSHSTIFGEYIYKVELKSNLNLFDSTNISDCEKLFDYLNNDYQDSIELLTTSTIYYYNKFINTPEKLANYRNNWEILEKNAIWNWLLDNYDGVILTEMNSKNVFIKNPVQDKILHYEYIGDSNNFI
jgi:hypothetical protein